MSTPSKAGKRNIKDKDLKVSHALYSGSGAGSVATSGLDLGEVTFARPQNRGLNQVELVLTIPATNGTMQPDTKTYTYLIEMDDDVAFGSPTTLATKVTTGVSTAGAAATELRVTVPSSCERFVRGKATAGANCTDASAVAI